MITFIGHLKALPGKHADLEALFSHVRDQTLANEPGVAWYSFAKSAEDAGTYVLIEVYRDAAAHSAHMQEPWVVESIPKTRVLIQGGFAIKQYTSPGTPPVPRLMKEN
jgi:quinol monooxygenase YgiN